MYLFVADNKFICDCRLAWMYKLKNETRNNQIRNILDELTCRMTEASDPNLEIESEITNPKDDLDDNSYSAISENTSDYIEESYYNQQDSSNNYVSEKLGDPSIRHLFMIPQGNLPCPNEKPTEPPYNYLNTPAYAEINSGCHRICAVLSLVLLAVLACLT